MTELADLRKIYARGSLSENEVDPDPILQFRHWMAQALTAEVLEPNAMTLATASIDGKPSARIVLIKGVDQQGFTFFTNYLSTKGQQLADNPHAALLFYWSELERQVRITGHINILSEQESDAYYHSRPLDSRLGAWASEQSQIISNRECLVERMEQFAQRFGEHPPRPPHWGGYRLIPEQIEFWQGRPSRLHDRICYQRMPEGGWKIYRVAP